MEKKTEKFNETFWEWLWRGITHKWDNLKAFRRSFSKLRLRIDTLDENWWDKDHVMLHACFQLLVNFFEEEEPEEFVVFDEGLRELKRLYIWWTVERPMRSCPYDDKHFIGVRTPNAERVLAHHNGGKMSDPIVDYSEYHKIIKECGEREDVYEREDQEKLEQLIKLRGFMWT